MKVYLLSWLTTAEGWEQLGVYETRESAESRIQRSGVHPTRFRVDEQEVLP